MIYNIPLDVELEMERIRIAEKLQALAEMPQEATRPRFKRDTFETLLLKKYEKENLLANQPIKDALFDAGLINSEEWNNWSDKDEQEALGYGHL